MPRTAANYDVELIRQAAAARWPEIISNIAGVDIRILDGHHHGCPKCGGKDRFRMIDIPAGALLCEQCFKTKNGDGFAALQWLKGYSFQDALKDAADYLGIEPIPNGSHKRGKSGPHKPADPGDHLEFLPWSDLLVSYWCMAKPPISPEAVKRCGGKIARYRNQWTVIAIPAKDTSGKIVAYAMYEITGGSLPKFGDEGVKWVKVKLTAGSSSGLMKPQDDP